MSAKIEDLARRRAERDRLARKKEPAGPAPEAGGNRGGRCPICGRSPVQAHRPFCSKRCAEIDLGRWLKQSYRVKTDERPEDAMPGKGEDED
jgi:endogenous inhibitor of DNA gyrase (YacG/DUF329 family)